MRNTSYDHGYGIKWKDVFVEKRERFKTSVTDFHEHDFYEVNLILSGNIKVVVADQTVEGTTNKIVLAKPDASHFIACKPDLLYSSLFLVFSEEFIQSRDLQWMQLLSVFGEKGAIITITPEQTQICADIIHRIDAEENILRKRLLVYYLLSYIDECAKALPSGATTIPTQIYQALAYIDAHYAQTIVAGELAEKLYIGRTTLMTQFKKHTGKTIHEYVTDCRLRSAIRLLSEGKTQQEAAVLSGFSDSSALIQCFKRIFHMTPRQFLMKKND